MISMVLHWWVTEPLPAGVMFLVGAAASGIRGRIVSRPVPDRRRSIAGRRRRCPPCGCTGLAGPDRPAKSAGEATRRARNETEGL
jgi:hypothetical protein